MRRELHPDWGQGDVSGESWDLPTPMGDLKYALEYGRVQTATFPTVKYEDRLSLAEVDKVVRYHVSYHGDVWEPNANVGRGSELDMYVVGQLVDGRWFSVVAWNDYTGWGCQDGSDIRIGDTEQEVIDYGLDEAGRRLLDY